MKRIAVVGVVAGAIALVGCYGYTKPATNLTGESAVLNGWGKANSGPASSVFKYWQTGSSAQPLVTPPLRWPAGAEGPIAQKIAQLASDTDYTFRLCGADDGKETICAQIVTFRSGPATEDAAMGNYFHACCASLTLDAHAGPAGQSPRGTVSLSYGGGFGPLFRFSGSVTCLLVDGNRAAIGAVGREQSSGTPPPNDYEATALIALIDGGPTTADAFGRTVTAGTTPPNCSSASFEGLFQTDINEANFVVNDATAQPTAR